jgi:hypothetical protein
VTIKNNIIKLTVTFVFFILVRPLFSQETLYHNKNVGFNIGANCAIGSHFQRFGISVNFFYVNNFFQAKITFLSRFNLSLSEFILKL